MTVGSHVYQLKAVLIHSGPSAYSGHYIAHIHDAQADVWYKFNDEVIEKMKSKNLELGNETDLGMSGFKWPNVQYTYYVLPFHDTTDALYFRREEWCKEA